ncbi:hypothetical protein KX729_31960 [Rhizobium sp. XQZ8]|nr:hypothetical protein [Rhizobium populisoli]
MLTDLFLNSPGSFQYGNEAKHLCSPKLVRFAAVKIIKSGGASLYLSQTTIGGELQNGHLNLIRRIENKEQVRRKAFINSK